MNLLIEVLARVSVMFHIPEEEPIKCTLKQHKFMGNQDRCLCGMYTWMEYCRRWDRR